MKAVANACLCQRELLVTDILLNPDSDWDSPTSSSYSMFSNMCVQFRTMACRTWWLHSMQRRISASLSRNPERSFWWRRGRLRNCLSHRFRLSSTWVLVQRESERASKRARERWKKHNHGTNVKTSSYCHPIILQDQHKLHWFIPLTLH